MVIHMNEARLTTIEQIEQFLSASTSIEFSGGRRRWRAVWAHQSRPHTL
jgi:hypothetical protein